MRVSAWRTWDDPCPANFAWAIEYDAERQASPEGYLGNGGKIVHQSGPWNGLGTSVLPRLRPNQLFDFQLVYDEYEAYYMVNWKNNSVISIAVVNQTTVNYDDKLIIN